VTETLQRPVLLPAPLGREVNALSAAQRRAVVFSGDSVVLAGPGAGKTRMLVAKAAYLTFAHVRAPQRVGCLTFATKAAEEIRRRLRSLHASGGQHVTCATVHAFCLNEIFRPFAAIAGQPPLAAGSVIDTVQQSVVRQRAYDRVGLREDPRWTESRDVACRRSLYAGETPRFDRQVVAAAAVYNQLLVESNLLDFEAMVGRSLQIIRDRPTVCRLVAARFPWLLIDEYQDLGPVLHGIVSTLRAADVEIFAVGDPDQCIHGFTGSDPRYLLELARDPEFRTEQLQVNYRAGQALVSAAAAVLGEDRGYTAHDQTTRSVLEHRPVASGIRNHAAEVARVITDLVAAGVATHEIAILYPRNRRKVPIRDWLLAALSDAGIAVASERAQQLPRARIVSFLQKAASWQFSRQSAQPLVTPIRFDELAEEYTAMRATSWHQMNERLPARVDLWQALAANIRPDDLMQHWVSRLDESLNLRRHLSRAPEAEELLAVDALLGPQWSATTMAEFAGDAEAAGKVVVTTYHSSKGREWPYVILPGLQEGVVPDWPLDYGNPRPPGSAYLAQERRLFYVALTRAKQAVVLIYTPGRPTLAGSAMFLSAPSRFIADLPLTDR
jgi:DNA helicase II / ATP-dependent DNA helicase PcrA